MNIPNQNNNWEKISLRENRHINVVLGCAERLLKTLFIINAGGLATVLAYSYQNNLSHFSHKFLIIAILSFLMGILLTTGLITYDYLWSQQNYTEFKDKITCYEQDPTPTNINHALKQWQRAKLLDNYHFAILQTPLTLFKAYEVIPIYHYPIMRSNTDGRPKTTTSADTFSKKIRASFYFRD